MSALGLLAALPLLSSCANTDPMEAETKRSGDSATVKSATLAAAAEGRDVVVGLYPDLELDHDPDRDDRWHDCSGLDAGVERDGDASPERIQWLSKRSFYPAPARATEPLIDTVLADLVSGGWAIDVQSANDTRRDVFLRREGYTLSVGGTSRVVDGRDPSLVVSVSSPCIEAPADLDEPDAVADDA